MAEKGLGIQRHSPPAFHWELGSNIMYSRNKAAIGLLPCITKSHTVWDVQGQKPWLGLQLMMAQGFPSNMKLKFDPSNHSKEETIPSNMRTIISDRLGGKCELNDRDLKQMAGNTMTIPIMGLLQVARGGPTLLLKSNKRAETTEALQKQNARRADTIQHVSWTALQVPFQTLWATSCFPTCSIPMCCLSPAGMRCMHLRIVSIQNW